jgi:hypothetical protein
LTRVVSSLGEASRAHVATLSYDPTHPNAVAQADALPARVAAVLASVPAGGEAAYDALAAAVWEAFAA